MIGERVGLGPAAALATSAVYAPSGISLTETESHAFAASLLFT